VSVPNCNIFYRSQQHDVEIVKDESPFLPPMPRERYNAYTFTVDKKSQNRHHLMLLIPCVIIIFISMFIRYTYTCNRWTAIVELCGSVFMVACDAIFLLRFPKFPIFTHFVTCTIAACVIQCIGNYIWCQQLDWTHEIVLSYLPYILLVPYCVKLYYLFLLLKTNFITLQTVLLVDVFRDVLLCYPITMIYYTPRLIHDIDYKSGNLLVLGHLIAVLDKAFLKLRGKVLKGDDTTSYYDKLMEIIAMFVTVKRYLYRRNAEFKTMQAEYEETSRKFDCIKKSYREIKKERFELKKQLDDALSKGLDNAGKMVAKQLTKLRENVNCCICHDRIKNILLQPCNHLSVCEHCLEEVLSHDDKVCPLCREKIKEHVKVFL